MQSKNTFDYRIPSFDLTQEMKLTKRVLILGASGMVGGHSAKAFKAGGWEVQKFNRATNNMIKAAEGCDVIVNGLNPKNYNNWALYIPQITKQVLEAAESAGSTVIVPGNVYHFGDQEGEWSEHTKPEPVSKKGEIRLKMERKYKASNVQTIVLRGGNFIDPDSQNCVMSKVYLRNIKQGKITLPGPASTMQAMCYLPDWARAAVELAEMRQELRQFEDVPFAGQTVTALDIKVELEQILKRELKFVQFPWLLFKVFSPVWELASEMNEMRYLWNTNHRLSEMRLKQLLPKFETTPLKEVLTELMSK